MQAECRYMNFTWELFFSLLSFYRVQAIKDQSKKIQNMNKNKN